MQLESVQIGVVNLAEAASAYELLLGVPPLALPGGGRRFQLARGAVELERATPGLQSIAFAAAPDSAGHGGTAEVFNGIQVRSGVAAPAAAGLPDPARVPAIDHIVVHTMAPERAIALWRDRFGLRLALDREFPDRGVRLLFFRSGGITLEYASPAAPGAPAPGAGEGADRFYGVSYRVPDLQQWRGRLVAAGVEVSEIRAGKRPGSSVCSVRSGTAGVPTLLLALDDPR